MDPAAFAISCAAKYGRLTPAACVENQSCPGLSRTAISRRVFSMHSRLAASSRYSAAKCAQRSPEGAFSQASAALK
jgi:hypothetical protein